MLKTRHRIPVSLNQLIGCSLRLASTARDEGKRPADTFRRATRGKFFQAVPHLRNPFVEDTFVQSYLKRTMPDEVRQDVFADLELFGARIRDEIEALGRQAEENPPYLRPYNGWGQRIDDLVTSSAWQHMHSVSASEGLVAIAYQRRHQQWSRLHQMVKLYLFSPSSGLYSCPLAMTDGAAKLIEGAGDQFLLERPYRHLTSDDPKHFWTSGQWMTERGGGSDVAGGTDTVATPQSDGTYHLHGYKWFTSATDANMAFTLARVVDNNGLVTNGTKGLSLFYVETRKEDGTYNNLEIQCLKNKLGTRQLPTAELLLDGTEARLVGEQGRGVPGISSMLTITRLHNSIAAVAGMRRFLQLSRDYSTKRVTFGSFLADHPLHMQTLARMEVETRGCTLFTLEMCRLLGLDDCGMASPTDAHLLRLLTPVLKLYTAKQICGPDHSFSQLVLFQLCLYEPWWWHPESLESFGGQGYIEDTGLPTLFRDAQVLPIWEGTTNILSLDVLRVLQKSNLEALKSFVSLVKSRISNTRQLERKDLLPSAVALGGKVDRVVSFVSDTHPQLGSVMESAARDFSYSLAHIFIGALLLEHATSPSAMPQDTAVASRWCSRPLPLAEKSHYLPSEHNMDLVMVMDGRGLDKRANE
eukprot:Em0015g480a